MITGNCAGSGGPGENEVPGDGGSGGGLYPSAGTVTLTKTTVSGNFAGYAGAELTGDGPANAGNGGGVFNAAKLVVTGSTFSSNGGSTGQALGSDGGGIYNTGTATITTSTFTGNHAGSGSAPTGRGGAIANVGTLTLANSTLSGNQAAAGAAGNPEPLAATAAASTRAAALRPSAGTRSPATRAVTAGQGFTASRVSRTAVPAESAVASIQPRRSASPTRRYPATPSVSEGRTRPHSAALALPAPAAGWRPVAGARTSRT
jgi:hypothetical protein